MYLLYRRFTRETKAQKKKAEDIENNTCYNVALWSTINKMPGLNQLKKFSEDVANLGNEISIRKERGEQPVQVALPVNISEADDSDDFVFGLPGTESDDQTSGDDLSMDALQDIALDNGDSSTAIDTSIFPELDSILNGAGSASADVSGYPDLDQLLNPAADSSTLSAAAADSVPETFVPAADLAPEKAMPQENPAAETASPGLSDFPDLDELLNPVPDNSTLSAPAAEPAPETVAPQQENPVGEAASAGLSDFPDLDELLNSVPDNSTLSAPVAEPTPETVVPQQENPVPEFRETDADSNVSGTEQFDTGNDQDSVISAADDGVFNIPDIPDFDMPDIQDISFDTGDSLGMAEQNAADSAPDTIPDPFSTEADAGSATSATADNTDFGDDSVVPAEENLSFQDDSLSNAAGQNPADDTAEKNTFEPDTNGMDAGAETFDIPDIPDFDMPDVSTDASLQDEDFNFDVSDIPDFFPDVDEPEKESSVPDTVPDTDAANDGLSESSSDFDISGALDDLPSFDDVFNTEVDSHNTNEAADTSEDQPDGTAISEDFSFKEEPAISIETGGVGEDGPAADKFLFAEDTVPDDAGEEEPAVHEIFEAPEDPFDGEPPAADSDIDDPFSGSDFSDFDIPGFSDQSAGAAQSAPRRKLKTNDGALEKNTLTDTQYKIFRKNLAEYPLNIRIAFEELIVNDEFKDEIVFDLIQKVIKKISARQLAIQLDKLLDVGLSVPRDFERRTYEQYEEYKKSLEYQVKNRILPVALLGIMSACILFLLFLFCKNMIYRPVKAEILYSQGYELLENGAYPQSELKFNEAIAYQQKKRWFLKYADGYRQHKQYERARTMYTSALQRFNHDKETGLLYARMEMEDLRNFENAEAIVRREILDYHINDKDGLLLLGDIFLEWGDEKDPAKYEDARQIYAELIQLYGQKDLYLARMMRYFIRVDDLRNVLQLKEHFYPRKKSLGGQDLIELSGYLLEKLYGYINPADEYLRASIEDVRELLERAATAAPDVPESRYNMGLYFVHTNNTNAAKDWLAAAVESFKTAATQSRNRLLRYINTYRLLGELYSHDDEFLSAEQYYRTGIELYESAVAAGFTGNNIVGQLYADLADLNYFVIGDMDVALKNYLAAIPLDNDTASIRYRVGYIQYVHNQYMEALGSFIKAVDYNPTDTHILLALGNVLSIRGDNFAAQGYYEQLMQILDAERVRYGILFPQINMEHTDIVDLYLKASNNLGVTLYRLARQTGDSSLNAEALANLSMSIRAWDAMTRNQETMVRLGGSNLAERNIAYMSYPVSDYEPSIYTEIPRVLDNEVIPY